MEASAVKNDLFCWYTPNWHHAIVPQRYTPCWTEMPLINRANCEILRSICTHLYDTRRYQQWNQFENLIREIVPRRSGCQMALIIFAVNRRTHDSANSLTKCYKVFEFRANKMFTPTWAPWICWGGVCQRPVDTVSNFCQRGVFLDSIRVFDNVSHRQIDHRELNR